MFQESAINGIDRLRTLHTKQLLALKDECYKSFPRLGYARCHEIVFSREDLKQVLSERPHIPNAAESKQIRQTAAKQKVRLQRI